MISLPKWSLDASSMAKHMNQEGLGQLMIRLMTDNFEEATLAPRLKKDDGHLDWSRPAPELVNLVRGCNPWPGALTRGPAGPLLIWRASAVEATSTPQPGTLVAHGQTMAITTGAGALLPIEVQAEGRRAMAWQEYLRGVRLAPGGAFSPP
jgi:methionyl-tRNA formyltransferase